VTPVPGVVDACLPLPVKPAAPSASNGAPETVKLVAAPVTDGGAADAAPAAAIAVAAPAGATDSVTPAAGDAPPGFPTQPQTPLTVLSSCGGTGSAQTSQRGAGAPTAAILGAALAVPVAPEEAARTAPAAGSVGATTADPATRPD
jgi:hypothetical protein